ncbi:peptidoglycan DD-metalloendopeptidase family protein [Ichthyenterobacterium sp. W332]|uniref:Peptidoglycan DD-metalloendopeptidase family protein n=1 Tax=Microcosmobacter mediterraneus TaxID=3075607 RepID=A0ABU2YG62_9FLAO|nr:peptidoglycan DD-metalloendopeptidase family protein [Ichthyenterobacterium sp. W332]MDT0557146.1 peptidoglycan DD-metalloendopeptidase family protein [Ichthyenterobacterium sp. W332]
MITTLENVLKRTTSHPVIDPSIEHEFYTPLDLSIDNPNLLLVDVSSPVGIQNYINSQLQKHKAKLAFGGYLEERSIYNRSKYFNNSVLAVNRNIHLGLDLWISAGTRVHSPLDGILHSFKNNTNFGDYGPTIILEHKLEGYVFYTLYGHLSLESLEDKQIGQEIRQGQNIATLGEASVNGEYAPHLHFQIIKDLQGNKGDYPGVSSKQDVDFYKLNCPDPQFLLF